MELQKESEEAGSGKETLPTDDPIAGLTAWNPLVKGGANFRTHKLKKVGFHSYVSTPTIGYHIFYSLFILFGTGGLIGAYFSIQESWFLVFMLLLMGGIFLAVGGYLGIKAQKPFTIDLDLGTFYRGHSYDPYDDHDKGESGSIRDIHAIQLISENIKSDDSTYTSYEINLVLKDGRRINVMDHGRKKKIYEDVQLLSDVLRVPVWDANTTIK